jgi:hypothetical protein
LDANRKYIRSSTASVLAPNGAVTKCTLFLFNDMLLVTSLDEKEKKHLITTLFSLDTTFITAVGVAESKLC